MMKHSIQVDVKGIWIPEIRESLSFRDSFGRLSGSTRLGKNLESFYKKGDDVIIEAREPRLTRTHYLMSDLMDFEIERAFCGQLPSMPISVAWGFIDEFQKFGLGMQNVSFYATHPSFLFYVYPPWNKEWVKAVAFFKINDEEKVHAYHLNPETPEGENRHWHAGYRLVTLEP